MENAAYGGVLAVPLIVGLVEVAKRAGLGTAWSAPLAISLGLALRLGYLAALGTWQPVAWVDAAVQGLALGLAAAGLYSGVKRLGDDRMPTGDDRMPPGDDRMPPGDDRMRMDDNRMPPTSVGGSSPLRRAPTSVGPSSAAGDAE